MGEWEGSGAAYGTRNIVGAIFSKYNVPQGMSHVDTWGRSSQPEGTAGSGQHLLGVFMGTMWPN